ncbi:hypothetical protein ACFC09_36785 [Streptomyces sp. NPDC056161]|uniref:hypothetical protein n=1 Tax=Streptomyces sp. NPDC056161 TaxID=3345732 RepID=UPI0035DFB304
MLAAEAAADDVRPAPASVEEPARLGGELDLVSDPAVYRQAALEIGVDQLVRVEPGRGNWMRDRIATRNTTVTV